MNVGPDDNEEGLVEWQPDLNEEQQAQVARLRQEMEPRIRFMVQLREALGLSQVEFLQFMQQDEFVGLPPHVPRSTLTISKLQAFVEERGGNLSLTITLDGKTFVIPQ